MDKLTSILIFFIPVLFYSQKETTKIQVGFGPEDFEIDASQMTKYTRLLVVCDERREGMTQGEIWEVNLETLESRKIEIDFKNEEVNFHPHGMSIYKNYLFVISHNDKTEEFYRFKIEKNRVVLDTLFSEGIIGQGNDLFAVSKDEFYYSDFKMLGGSIIHYCEGDFQKVVKHLKYPNGVYVLGEVLYLTTTLQNKVFAYDLVSEEKVKIAKVKGGDNLTYDGENLYTTSHPKFGKFIKHYKDASKKSPSVVYQIGISNNQVIYEDDGAAVSAASVALKYNGMLFIGQVFDDFILMVK